MKVDPRPLTADEQMVLGRLLEIDFQGVLALREQALSVRVVGHCDCGCPSINLGSAVDIERSDQPGRLVPAELTIAPLADEPPGEVILFIDDGRLSYLEYVFYSETPPTAWPSSDRLSVVTSC